MELGEDGTEAAEEKFLLLRHRWRGTVKDFVGGAGGDHLGDHPRVQGLEDAIVVVQGDDAAHGVWGDIREVRGLDCFFFLSRGPRGMSKGLRNKIHTHTHNPHGIKNTHYNLPSR